MLLRDALRVVLVLATSAPERFPAAAVRFGARPVSERRLSVAEARVRTIRLGILVGPTSLVSNGKVA